MPRLASLPFDVLLNILRHLPKYSSLRSAILSCSVIHDVYCAQSQHILFDIAVTLCGGRERVALQAICAIRIDFDIYDPTHPWSSHTALPTLVNIAFNDATAGKKLIRVQDARMLISSARFARRLETIFSARNKDRVTGLVSTLDDEESLRFALAFYRLEVLLSLSRRHLAAAQWKDRAQRDLLFYSRFSNEELFHIYEIYVLLNAIRIEARGSDPSPSDERYTVKLGMERTLLLFKHPEKYAYNAGRLCGISGCLADFRRHLAPNLDMSLSRPPGVLPIVLKPVADKCSVCPNPINLPLCNIKSWHNWPRQFRLDILPAFFPSRLSRNKYESSALLLYLGVSTKGLKNVVDVEPVHQLVPAPQRICNVVSALYDMKLGDIWDTISPIDWICAECLGTLIESRLWAWWAAKKAELDLRDCQYGVNCQMQTRGTTHARRYNHACPDISDAYQRLLTAAETRVASGGALADAVLDVDDNDLEMLHWRFGLAYANPPDDFQVEEFAARCKEELVLMMKNEARFRTEPTPELHST